MMVFQQGMHMWANPHTAMALVEITAYVCYALEMEGQALHMASVALVTAGGTGTSTKAQQCT